MIKRVFDPAPSARRIARRIGVVLALFWVWALPAFASGPKQEFVKNINREFSTNANGTTALYNKYGTVTVKTWANNSVKIDINIRVNASNQSAADKMFERIQVNFANTTGYVKAETVIQNRAGWWIEDNLCQDYKINYEVWMPAGNSLDLKNKYGDSYVADLSGKLYAEIKYGNLRTETLAADADLNLSYGKTFINSLNNLYGQISYGELHLTTAKNDLQIDTRYSELHVDRANTVRLTSKYDEIQLGDINDLRVQTKYSELIAQKLGAVFITAQFTDLKMKTVTTSADLDLSYGSTKIETLGRDFTDVNIVAKYTDLSVGIDKMARYNFKIEASYTDIPKPSSASVRRSERSSTSEVLEGYVGDSNARASFKGRIQYGSFMWR